MITRESIEVLKFYLRDKDAVKKEALEVIEELERRIEWAKAELGQGLTLSAIGYLTLPDKEPH